MPTRTQPTGEESLKVEQLFNWGRAKQGPIPLWHKLLLLAYLPFGVVLLVVRSLVFLLFCILVLTLPRSISDPINVHLLRFSTGIIVYHNYKGKPLADVPHIIACNHVSDFDTFAIWIQIRRYWCIASAHLKAIPIIGATYTALDCIFVAPTPESREATKNTMKDKLANSKVPILIFPEGGLTSGKIGTMLYQKFVFSLDCGVVPCAVALKDPWPVDNDYIGSSWGKNFFWFMMLPYHIYEITFLPVQFRRESETPEEFAFRVQSITSHHLGIVPTKFPYAMKKELVKKLKEEQSQKRQQQQPLENKEKTN